MSSETLAGASEGMGVPAELVQRSAQARANADGIGVDEVLTAWSGGATITPAAPPAAREPIPEPGPAIEAPPAVAETAPQTAPTASPAAEPAIVIGAPSAVVVLEAPAPPASPVLKGRRESPVAVLAAAVGLFLVALLFAFVLPALDATPQLPPPSGLSALGLQGREIYVAEGCWYCHTQQVRPIVTDANLGPVTQPELLASFAPDTLGIQRIGPDLAHAGSREPTNDAQWLTAFLTEQSSVREASLQPGYGYLSEADVAALVQYLLESR
ncbi:MAG: cbb3-type cytochrome c oxidase subunit II [Acidimicrobiia bacterium]|nr:cbb3-type cytochrome c oxidase subunit II [Acidimicrobiia bacterium]MDH3397217.1 cbb3-type cytochrome c oxidase subunit II [Acidimicrobiia bacterium]